MSNFFVNVITEDNKFVGVVYNKDNNILLYRTQRRSLHQDALNEANMFLRNQAPPAQSSPTQPPKRCCGR